MSSFDFYLPSHEGTESTSGNAVLFSSARCSRSETVIAFPESVKASFLNTTHVLVRLCLCMSFFSLAGAQTRWRILPPPTTKNLTKLCFLDRQQGWVAGRKGTILKTTDGGAMWTHQDPGFETDIVSISMLNEQRGWALSIIPFVDTTLWYGTRILKTTSGGEEWTSGQFPVTGRYLSSIVFLDSILGWVGGANGDLFRTTDGGNTWREAATDSSLFTHLGISKLRFYSARYGFAVGGRLDLAGVVWKTTDGGNYWTTRGVTPEPIYDLHFIDSTNIIGVGGDFEFGACIVRTEDGGREWEYEFLGIFGLPSALSFRTPAEGWAPVGATGMFIYTSDTGGTWQAIHTPARKAVYDLAFVDSSIGYAVGDSGTILKYVGGALNVNERITSPPKLPLFQCFPNPCNSSATIEYALPQDAQVRVEIFNMLGQHVMVLVDEAKEAGYYRTKFDGRTLASGAYVCRISAYSQQSVPDYVALKKLVLLR